MTDTPDNEPVDAEARASAAVPAALPDTLAGASTDETTRTEAADTKATIDTYGVNLDVFEGPLDLLLYLIRKSEVDIYDIPVAKITTQYLAFLRAVHLLDLESAADFILMAATLMKIKSQMLLPRDIEGEDLDEGLGDPREELVRKLLEYQQFKEIADWLSDQDSEQRDIYQRPGGLPEDAEDAELQPVSLFDLLKVYKHVIDHVPQAAVHRIVEEEVAIEECIERVLSELNLRSRLRFHDLISGQSKVGMVATFIGILELLKSQRIRVQQAQPFDDIWIERNEPAEESPTVGSTSAADTESEIAGVVDEEGEGPVALAETDHIVQQEQPLSAQSVDDVQMTEPQAAPEQPVTTTPPVPPAQAQTEGATMPAPEPVLQDESADDPNRSADGPDQPAADQDQADADEPSSASPTNTGSQTETGPGRAAHLAAPATPPASTGPAHDPTASDATDHQPPAPTALATQEPDSLEADASRLVDAAERLGDQVVPPAPEQGLERGQLEVWEETVIEPTEEEPSTAGAKLPPPPAQGTEGLSGPEERT